MIIGEKKILWVAVLIGLLSCNSGKLEGSEQPPFETVPEIDSSLINNVLVDSSWHVFPPFDEVNDPNLDTTEIIGRSLDSLHNEIEASTDFTLAPDTNAQIVGKWLVHQKLNGSGVASRKKEVFAVYHQDSIFSMKAINVLGKWWIEGNLLLQKYELPTKVNIDTSKINVLNDSVLQVSELHGDAQYIFKKID